MVLPVPLLACLPAITGTSTTVTDLVCGHSCLRIGSLDCLHPCNQAMDCTCRSGGRREAPRLQLRRGLASCGLRGAGKFWNISAALLCFRALPLVLGGRPTSKERLGGLCGDRPMVDSDLMSYWIVSLWDGFTSRTDLPQLREMGVRALHLDHCVVEVLHVKEFLDKAWVSGLRVIPELQHSLFSKPEVGCFATGFDCYETLRHTYREILGQEGIWASGHYHPAVEMIILMRDPEVAAAEFCSGEGCGPPAGLIGVLSAWDGFLDAEAELGVVVEPATGKPGSLGFTVLFATGAAGGGASAEEQCYNFRSETGGCAGTNALRALYQGVLEPPGWSRNLAGQGFWRRGLWPDRSGPIQNVTYMPHSNLTASFLERWIHTFHSASTYDQIVAAMRTVTRCHCWRMF
ncbi:unnamed protein product [Polarella glacialis]|uniref:Uncharacterized protein n=1 Tax=Polarella glacialis TaxID=89957 RepID=A0A813E6Y0_POLGL|nr:unnamed protein product [Polarella glacialis]